MCKFICIFVKKVLPLQRFFGSIPMKRSVKISLWVIGVFFLLVVSALMSADIWVSRLVQKEVHKTFDQMPDADAQIGSVYLSIISGTAIVKDVTFVTHSLALEDEETGLRQPGLAMHVPTLTVWNINYWELFKHRHVDIYKISIDEPKLLVYLDEEHPTELLPSFPKDTTLEKAGQWLRRVDVRHIEVNKFTGHLHSVRTPLVVAVDSLSVECRSMAYSFADSVFTYNDSVYDLRIEGIAVQLPDGESALEVKDFETEDQGPLQMGYTRFYNTLTAKQLANKHREPTTWMDLELNSLRTSPLNPIRKGIAKDFSLDSLHADVKRMHVCRDARLKPREPFLPPQDYLKKTPIELDVKHVDALVRKIDVEYASTNVNCGQLHVRNLRADVSNITTRRGATWLAHARAPFGKNGHVDASYKMHLNKAANFDLKLKVKDVDIQDLNSFLRPLVGLTCECHVDQLDAAYSGDRTSASGEFCMQYHGLKVQVHKEDDIPYKIVTKNADTFTTLANTLIPKSNPTAVDPAPRRYMVEWKRNEWEPYPLYLFGCCIDGAVKTMLPGLFVHKQAKSKKK